MILERDVLPATIPEFPTVRRMPLVVWQRSFKHGWGPLFIGYSAAAYFHKSGIKINSWTSQANQNEGLDASENRCPRGQEGSLEDWVQE